MKRNRGNNRIENTIALFKKIRDTKGTFLAKMGRNGMDLMEAADIEVARIHRRAIQKRSS